MPKKNKKNKQTFSYNFSKISSWNIHGAYYLINNYRINKLEDPDFINVIDKHDILCLQETHCSQNDSPHTHLTKFDGIPHCRKASANNKHYGGMMLLVRKTIRAGVKVVSTSDPEILGVKMDRNFFGLKEDIHIWFTYAPPITSPYARSRKNVLDCLEKTLFSYQNNIVMGDLNGRTSIEKDFIEEKYDEHSPVNDIVGYDFDTPVKRNNSDTSPVDTHGRRVLDICQTISLCGYSMDEPEVTDGAISQDSPSKPTRDHLP